MSNIRAERWSVCWNHALVKYRVLKGQNKNKIKQRLKIKIKLKK